GPDRDPRRAALPRRLAPRRGAGRAGEAAGGADPARGGRRAAAAAPAGSRRRLGGQPGEAAVRNPRAQPPSEAARALGLLWERRRLVALGAAAALLAALLAVYRLELLPPKLEKRSNVFATASTQILVDTPD